MTLIAINSHAALMMGTAKLILLITFAEISAFIIKLSLLVVTVMVLLSII